MITLDHAGVPVRAPDTKHNQDVSAHPTLLLSLRLEPRDAESASLDPSLPWSWQVLWLWQKEGSTSSSVCFPCEGSSYKKEHDWILPGPSACHCLIWSLPHPTSREVSVPRAISKASHSLFVLACVPATHWRCQLKLFTGFIWKHLEVFLKFCFELQQGQA